MQETHPVIQQWYFAYADHDNAEKKHGLRTLLDFVKISATSICSPPEQPINTRRVPIYILKEAISIRVHNCRREYKKQNTSYAQ
jgi:hypothetical protein